MFSWFNIFTEFYVLVDIVIAIILRMKKSGGTSRDRDQGHTYKSESEKEKTETSWERNVEETHEKKTFVKSDTGEVNKEQELVVIFLTFSCNPFMH